MYRWVRQRHMMGLRGRNFLEAPGAGGVVLLVCVIAYACLFAVDAIFKTDFRIWTFAFKTFEASAIPAAVKYMPFFFVYYFVSGAAAISSTSSEKLQGGWGYLL